jgi:hypothetical protein
VGKYVTVGMWIFDREVPRSFEKYEWNPRMLRLTSLNLDDYAEEDKHDAAFQIAQFMVGTYSVSCRRTPRIVENIRTPNL